MYFGFFLSFILFAQRVNAEEEIDVEPKKEEPAVVAPVIEEIGVVEEQPAVEPEVIPVQETPVQVRCGIYFHSVLRYYLYVFCINSLVLWVVGFYFCYNYIRMFCYVFSYFYYLYIFWNILWGFYLSVLMVFHLCMIIYIRLLVIFMDGPLWFIMWLSFVPPVLLQLWVASSRLV